jgi:sterol desaturase/sphingolipid hydroxylase (fatty acid hydroxylase superfamily)
MHELINYFATAPDWHRVAILAGSIFLFWNVENVFALTLNYKKWKHARTNAMFIFPAIPVQALLGYLLVKIIDFNTLNQVGLIYWIPGLAENPLMVFLISFLFLDFCEYVYHLAMHKSDSLWRFHVVHHSDDIVDTSTVLREHPGETFIRLAFLLVWVASCGVPFWALIFRQFIQIASNVFAHSNYRLSEKANKYIGLVFITPNIHHVHHHYKQPFTDHNYGDVLSIWDRMFGTFTRLAASKTVFGIDTYLKEIQTAKFKDLAFMPFANKKAAGKAFVVERSFVIKALIISGLLIGSTFFATAQQNPWKFIKEKDGVKVFYRASVSGNINEVKITTTFETLSNPLITTLTDVNNYPKWVYGASDSRLVKQLAPLEMEYYNKIDFPWPLTDRDVVVHSKIERNPKTGVITSTSSARPKNLPLQDGYVRIKLFESRWLFTPKPNGIIEGEYTFTSDPSGNIPSWAVNLALDEGPVTTIINFKKILKQENI